MTHIDQLFHHLICNTYNFYWLNGINVELKDTPRHRGIQNDINMYKDCTQGINYDKTVIQNVYDFTFEKESLFRTAFNIRLYKKRGGQK